MFADNGYMLKGVTRDTNLPGALLFDNRAVTSSAPARNGNKSILKKSVLKMNR